MFAANHLSISGIDTDGDNRMNHGVLRIEDGSGNAVAVYDPRQKHGRNGQIINAEDAERRDLGDLGSVTLDDNKVGAGRPLEAVAALREPSPGTESVPSGRRTRAIVAG